MKHSKKIIYGIIIAIIVFIIIYLCCYKKAEKFTYTRLDPITNAQAEADAQGRFLPNDRPGYMDDDSYINYGAAYDTNVPILNLAENNNTNDYSFVNQENMPTQTVAQNQVMPQEEVLPTEITNRAMPIKQAASDYYLLDDGDNGNLSIINNKCSKSCCNQIDWPTPFENKGTIDPGYVPTNMFCSNSVENGCLCATPKQLLNLQTRGGNSPY